MEGLIIRFSFLISTIYIVISFFQNKFYQDYLLNGIILFVVSATMFLIVHYLVLKYFIDARVELLQEDLVNKYNYLKKVREEKDKEEEKEEEERRKDKKWKE